MKQGIARADLHLHSRYSKRPSEWILRKIGCAESYSDPKQLYDMARQRGMDFFTLTDHNTLEGALEVAHLPGAFVSEEITAYFPEDRCKIHVLAWGIDESIHGDISRLRRNIYELVEYLRERRVAHAVAHPLFSINGRLTMEHVEKLLVLFNVWELNGARDNQQNNTIERVVQGLTPEIMEELAGRHDIPPFGPRPWIKSLVGGSDDHSGLTVARSHTCVRGASSPTGFLAGIGAEPKQANGRDSGPKVLAHNLYSIAYQFYKHKFGLDRYMDEEVLLRFCEQVFTADQEEGAPRLRERLRAFMGYPRPGRRLLRSRPESLQEILQEQARRIILDSPSMAKLLREGHEGNLGREEVWFRFVDRMSEKIIKSSADRALDKLYGGNFFDLFHAIGSAGSLYTLLSPYFIAYSVFTKDRELCGQTEAHFLAADKPVSGCVKMAHFTDTLNDINGVARTLNLQVEIARKNGKALTMIGCGKGKAGPGVTLFEPIGRFDLPEYPGMDLNYPPVLKMVDYCFREGFTHVHAATPGPLGLAAMAVSRILKLPLYGTYHTALPQYASTLTDDAAMEEAMWKYVVWFYSQMDKVYVPSRATGKELAEKGIPKEKIRFYERGIDIERFHPDKRNGFYARRYGLEKEDKVLLYVGRVSREKNLPFLANSFRRLCQDRHDLRLVVVGDGPYLNEMKTDLEGCPAIFTGFLEGEDLAQAYASADLFLFPSTTDTFGNAVLEAQASGVPVIVTDQGGPQENLIPSKTGYVLPAGDEARLIQAIETLVDDPKQLTRMGREARTLMQSHTFEATYLRLWESYGEAACA